MTKTRFAITNILLLATTTIFLAGGCKRQRIPDLKAPSNSSVVFGSNIFPTPADIEERYKLSGTKKEHNTDLNVNRQIISCDSGICFDGFAMIKPNGNCSSDPFFIDYHYSVQSETVPIVQNVNFDGDGCNKQFLQNNVQPYYVDYSQTPYVYKYVFRVELVRELCLMQCISYPDFCLKRRAAFLTTLNGVSTVKHNVHGILLRIRQPEAVYWFAGGRSTSPNTITFVPVSQINSNCNCYIPTNSNSFNTRLIIDYRRISNSPQFANPWSSVSTTVFQNVTVTNVPAGIYEYRVRAENLISSSHDCFFPFSPHIYSSSISQSQTILVN